MTGGVVVAGGGLAGQRCCETLRARGFDGRVRMVCAEARPPYDRPPLSKGLLAGELDPVDVALRPEGWHGEHRVELVLGRRAAGLDPARRELRLDHGARLRYDELVVATGAEPRRLPALLDDAGALRPGVHELRTLDDALDLRRALAAAGRLAIVGGGLIGLEVAATARRLGVAVTIVEADPLPLGRVLGAHAGRVLAQLHREEGVDLRLGAALRDARGRRRVEELVLADGARVRCDAVLACVGVVPGTAWLAGAGLPADGVPVGDGGAVRGVPHLWAAGDAARTFDPVLGGHVAAGHWEAAARGGAAIALAMLGLPARPPAPPSFWSDQYGVRLQCLGHPWRADRAAVHGNPGARDGALDFLRGDRLVGGLLVGRPRALPDLRRRLAGVPSTTETRSAA